MLIIMLQFLLRSIPLRVVLLVLIGLFAIASPVQAAKKSQLGVIQKAGVEVLSSSDAKLAKKLGTLEIEETVFVGSKGGAKDELISIQTSDGRKGWIPGDAVKLIEKENRKPATFEATTTFGDLGPVLSLGAPHPLEVNVVKKLGSSWEFSLGSGYFPFSFKFNTYPAQLTSLHVQAGVHWHPWDGIFYVGLIGGWQQFTGKVTFPIEVGPISVGTTISISASSGFVGPSLGWQKIWANGFLLGTEVGWSFTIAPNSNLTITTDNKFANIAVTAIQATDIYQDFTNKTYSAVNSLWSGGVPYAGLLRLGWIF